VSHRIISTILRHDSKQTSYKIAWLRALNDIVLAYPDVGRDGRDVAVPLRSLVEVSAATSWWLHGGAHLTQATSRSHHGPPVIFPP